MLCFRRLIACMLVLLQSLVAAGLGPRSICQDPDGSMRVDSALAPCCCHRQHEADCCDEDQPNQTLPADATLLSAGSSCRCVCTPVRTQPSVVQRTSMKATQDHVAVYPIIAVANIPATPLASTVCNHGHLFRTGPPGHTALDQLNSVILRL